jgi:hypothetical protein
VHVVLLLAQLVRRTETPALDPDRAARGGRPVPSSPFLAEVLTLPRSRPSAITPCRRSISAAETVSTPSNSCAGAGPPGRHGDSEGEGATPVPRAGQILRSPYD